MEKVRRWYRSQKTGALVFMLNPLVIGLAILSFGREEWWVTGVAGVCFGVFAAFLPVWLAELRKG